MQKKKLAKVRKKEASLSFPEPSWADEVFFPPCTFFQIHVQMLSPGITYACSTACPFPLLLMQAPVQLLSAFPQDRQCEQPRENQSHVADWARRLYSLQVMQCTVHRIASKSGRSSFPLPAHRPPRAHSMNSGNIGCCAPSPISHR